MTLIGSLLLVVHHISMRKLYSIFSKVMTFALQKMQYSPMQGDSS